MMPRQSTLRPLFLALCLLPFLSCFDSQDEETPRHVFLITVDTLRADHLSAYGYSRETSPRLDAIAEEATLFERAVAQWPKTGTSFASIFTGQFPQTTGLTHKAALRIPEAYFTLPQAMQRFGFDTVAVVSNGVLGKRLGWDRGFNEYEETWTLAEKTSSDPLEYRKWLNARVVNQLALPLLERKRDTEHLFAWIHYSDPHAPYYLPEDVPNPFVGDELFTGDAIVKLDNPEATMLGDRRDLKFYEAQYDANVRFTDEHFGKLIDHLETLGLLEDSLVIFSADHGESLGEHGYFFGHGRRPYNPGAVVPLLFWYPGRDQPPARIEHPVQMVDLYPTLWELLAPKGDKAPNLEGRSLVPELRGVPLADDLPPAFAEAGGGSPTTHFRSIQEKSWKLIFHPALNLGKRQRDATWELYNLERDPAETENLIASEEQQFRRLRAKLKSWMKGESWIRKSQAEVESYSQETEAHLRALGYANN